MKFKKSKKTLNTFISKNIIIKQLGFIESNFEIKNFNYEIKYELLKIFDKESKNYIIININQIYKIIYKQEKIILNMDNDTTISIEIKR